MAEEIMLYFAKDEDERNTFNAKDFLGVDAADANSLQVSFARRNGALDANLVKLTVDTTNSSLQEACKVLAGALAGQESKRGLTIIGDKDNGEFLYPFTDVEAIGV